jgi:hypothetical protein
LFRLVNGLMRSRLEIADHRRPVERGSSRIAESHHEISQKQGLDTGSPA